MRAEPPPVVDSSALAALLAACTTPIAVLTVWVLDFWPLLIGLVPLGIAAYRRAVLALAIVLALLAMPAAVVAWATWDTH